MSLPLQTLVTGLAVGGVYALMACGYSLIFSILSFSNFAFGGVVMLCSFCGWYAMAHWELSLPGALATAMAAGAMLCLLNEAVAYAPLRKRGAAPLYFMISAMGVSILLENLVYATIGSRYRAYPAVFSTPTVELFGAAIGRLDLFAIIFALCSIGGLALFLAKTRTGIAVRAAACDPAVAQLCGVRLEALIRLVFALAGLFAGVSGVFLGLKYMAYPGMGWITNKAYVAAVIGGLGSLPGAVLGGLLLGVLETFVSTYISSVGRDIFSFTALIAFLICMPAGLLGSRVEEKV